MCLHCICGILKSMHGMMERPANERGLSTPGAIMEQACKSSVGLATYHMFIYSGHFVCPIMCIEEPMGYLLVGMSGYVRFQTARQRVVHLFL